MFLMDPLPLCNPQLTDLLTSNYSKQNRSDTNFKQVTNSRLTELFNKENSLNTNKLNVLQVKCFYFKQLKLHQTTSR